MCSKKSNAIVGNYLFYSRFYNAELTFNAYITNANTSKYEIIKYIVFISLTMVTNHKKTIPLYVYMVTNIPADMKPFLISVLELNINGRCW